METEQLFKGFTDLPSSEDVIEDQKVKACEHPNVILENTVKVCEECGVMLNKDLNFEKEWRYYGISDTKHTNDPNRCNIRKSDDRSIYNDVLKLGFSDKIVSSANMIYESVTMGKIFRGNSRKGIIFACIFHAYKLNHNPQSCESLIDIFGITNKIGLKGLKFVNMNAPQNAPFRNMFIDIPHLIREILQKFHATKEQIHDAIKIYECVKDKSPILNRSRPQSVASGIVKYFIHNSQQSDITSEYFRTRVNLSELTINRIYKEISRIMDHLSSSET